jgi:hypothetical protein
MRARVSSLATSLLLMAGCAEGDHEPSATQAREGEVPRQVTEADAGAPPPPDAGTATGHAGDAVQVVVPERDDTPPTATVALAEARAGHTLARAAQPGGGHAVVVELAAPRLRGTVTGADQNGGVSRVRISITERIDCRRADGSHFERLRTRYFPPSEVERIRARPGVELPTRRRRSKQLALGGARCGPGARAASVHGELWGQAINAHGLEAVTPHIRFVYRP